jgi:hypothetical protein
VFAVGCNPANPNVPHAKHNHVTFMGDRVVIRVVALAATLLVGCGPSGGTVALVLDIPNAMLDPKGFSSVEVRLHADDGDTEINVAVVDGQFDLGEIQIKTDVMIEAALRTESGAAVGYGRAAAPADLKDGERIVIPVRRPIVYFAGLVNEDGDGDPATNDLIWTRTKPTYSDLATSTFLDGTTVLPDAAVMTVAAGPKLFIIDQMPMDPSGMLTGMPTIKSVSPGDHTVAAPLGAMLSGGVIDAAGSDDGRLLLVGTTTQLFVVDTESGTAKPIADGNFSRVAIVTAVDGTLTGLAIRNRSPSGACTAELVWVAASMDDTSQVMTIGTSGYTDVAGDVGRAFYVDSCKTGELGEASSTGTQMLRTALGKPTALAVSNGQAWIGVERASTSTAPAGVALVSAALVGIDPVRTLFDEPATQVVEATEFPGVQRKLDSQVVNFMQLEVGAGGDYVATTLAAKYAGDAIIDANFPRMEIESQELRVIDTATGASVQRYRSWCDGVLYITLGDIEAWYCATAPGQLAPDKFTYEHRISSMTFQYGK